MDGKNYCVDGDYGYSRRSYMEVKSQVSTFSNAHKAFNAAIPGAGVTLECILEEAKQSGLKWNIKVRCVREILPTYLHVSAMLLTSMHTCVYQNPASQYFRALRLLQRTILHTKICQSSVLQ